MKLEIRWHPRIGDAIVQRGIFLHLLNQFRPTDVCVPATPEAKPTIEHLYGFDAANAKAQLFIREVDPDPRNHTFYREPFWDDSLKVTFGAACPGFNYAKWDLSFYEQAGVPIEERFKCYQHGPQDFPANVFSNRPQDNQRGYLMKQRRHGRKLIIFHETREKKIPKEVRRRYAGRLDCKVVDVSPYLGPSILFWAPLIVDADEMHMVDSGPANLANSLMIGNSRLTIYAQDTPPPSVLNPAAGDRVTVEYVGKWNPDNEASSVCKYRG